MKKIFVPEENKSDRKSKENPPRTGKRRGQDEDEKGKLWLKRKKMKAKGKKRNLATD